MRHNNKAVTLVELLVVISIIAIIAAISLPVFVKSAKRARAVSCSNNLSQIFKALTLYTNDYDGWMPHVALAERSPSSVGSNWYRGDPETWTRLVTDYSRESQILFCPVARSKVVGTTESYYSERFKYTDYEFSSFLGPKYFGSPDGNFRLNLELLNSTGWPLEATKTVFISDVIFSGTGKDEGLISGHGVTAARVYMDGHVEVKPIVD